MRKRSQIDRAIVRDPSALLFDEPLSNLDAALCVGMRLEITEMHERMQTTMIHVTHDQVEAMTMANKIVVLQAGVISATSQGVMMFMMVPTTLAMIGCGFSEASAGDVIRWHVVTMFAPSFFTGFLIKRFGVTPLVTVGLVLLAISAAIGISGQSATHFYGALILLGAGWNFSYIGATDMLAGAVPDTEKSVAQGANDTVIALISTLCAFVSGAVIAALGWTVLSAMTLGIVALSFGVLFMNQGGKRPASSTLTSHY